MRTDHREIEMSVPRDRSTGFEPQILPKNSRDLSAQSISRLTDKIISLIEQWYNRPLKEENYFVFMDAIH